MKIISAVCLSSLLFLSCQGNAPELYQIQWVLVHSAGADGSFQREELMLFLHGEDLDGQGDLEYLQLENLDRSLQWGLEEQQWLTHEVPGELWLGYSGLSMPMGEDFPRGRYRVRLIDKSGMEDQLEWELGSRVSFRQDFKAPELDIREEGIRIKDPESRNWMLIAYQNGEMILNPYIKSHALFPIPEQWKTGQTQVFLLYVDPNQLEAWKQGPYYF